MLSSGLAEGPKGLRRLAIPSAFAQIFQPERVKLIREALEKEPIKWKTLVHLFLVTGARRGEILGLKWDKIDFENRTINISTSILYSPKSGVYEDTPKTLKSNRKISLPTETFDLLTHYRTYQLEKQLMLGSYYQNKNFIFTQENGRPLNPNSVTAYLKRFSKKYNLPHIKRACLSTYDGKHVVL